MGSTPVASGSSVPAWPTRWAPVNSRSRRTIVKEVAPGALSRLRTPARTGRPSYRGWLAPVRACDRLQSLREHHLDRLVHRRLDLSAGRPQVAATAELGGQGRGVDPAAAAHADLGERRADLLEEDRHLHPGDAVERVDDALRLGHLRFRVTQHAARHARPDELAVG